MKLRLALGVLGGSPEGFHALNEPDAQPLYFSELLDKVAYLPRSLLPHNRHRVRAELQQDRHHVLEDGLGRVDF